MSKDESNDVGGRAIQHAAKISHLFQPNETNKL